MKFLSVWVAAFCLATALQAQTTPATKPGTAKKTTTKPEVKKEPEAKIPGQTIPRANGTFLGLTLEDGKYLVRFYDAKKKPIAADVARASARWPNVHGPGDNRTVLNRSADGQSLLGAQFVRPPFAFKLFLTLIKDDGEAGETFVLDFRG
jgi:hypothetical protein